jgi:acetaldehyde dehydrogenase/alcohol dehydrogenase
MFVASRTELDSLIARVKKAQEIFATFPQKKVDEIFRSAALAASEARISLARMAVEETGMGVLEDKVIKNHFASEYIYNAWRDEKTCDVIAVDESAGTMTIAEPVGLVCAIVPTTNPTSTAIFKALIALKTRNGIIFSPHRVRAARPAKPRASCSQARWRQAHPPISSAGSMRRAPNSRSPDDARRHQSDSRDGRPGMVKAAYSSGKPAIGVGAGNTPAVIDETSDIKRAVASILMSKTFDNGVVCASEQSVIVVDEIYDAVRERFAKSGAYVLSPEEAGAVGTFLIVGGRLGDIVGQSAVTIADIAGVNVPENTKILIAEVTSYGEDEPFAHEKLSPTLAMYRARDFAHAVEIAEALVELGGIGHTSVLDTDQDNQRIVSRCSASV